MSNISPSSQKVDDFLSKISQLSQERLRESEKTKRSLQSDIYSLRDKLQNDFSTNTRYGDFEVSQLTFNRLGRDKLPSDSARSPPALPSRPKPAFEARNLDGFTRRNESGSEKRQSPSKTRLPPLNHNQPTLPSRPKPVGVPRTIEKPSKPENLRKADTFKVVEKPLKPAVLSGSQKLSSNERNDDQLRPKLPQRPSLQAQALAGLIRPVASKDTSIHTIPSQNSSKKVNIPNYVALQTTQISTGGAPTKIASFSDLETKIRARAGARDGMTVNPVSSLDGKDKLDEKLPIPASKPSKPSWAPALKPVTPVKPAKPTLRSFENQDTELLKDQIKRLSPTKTKQGEISRKFDFETEKLPASTPEQPRSNSNDFSKQALRPMKPAKPQALKHEPEVLFARGNLRKLQPKQPEQASVPEALRKFQSLKSGLANPPHIIHSKGEPKKNSASPRTNESNTNDNVESAFQNSPKSNIETRLTSDKKSPDVAAAPSPPNPGSGPKKPDFHAHLASIIRSLTEPSMMGPSTVKPVPMGELKRASTVPEPTNPENKLVHPNKSRAKGPKRRLPKLGSSVPSSSESKQVPLKKSAVSANTQSTNMETNGPAYDRVSIHGSSHETETSGKFNMDAKHAEHLSIRKPRKLPPPIARKPNFNVTPLRKVSGELFI
ncbi:hypothetical protein METSCH_E03250 [Metschnikowia aff. pulcherrima]|uniref:Uncharacterized protein n=1 Tax=Metschnikowia aff. pulcherrima TaxID=2163413 RepID=A0A4P6XUC7_9ASCO|nr:hypothetical protein METSCH_E03250 [Metschnikowia aff. pulcherrima]